MVKMEEEVKQDLFEQCYDLIHQDRIPRAAVAFSRVDNFTLKEFFDFCNNSDRQLGKEAGTTSGLLTSTFDSG